MIPWPDPATTEERTKEETREDRSPAESSSAAVRAEEVNVAPIPEDAASDRCLDPPVTGSDDRDLLADEVPRATDAAEVRAIEEVRVDPPADDAIDTARRMLPIGETLDYLFDRLKRFFDTLETSKRAVHRQPPVQPSIDEAVTPRTEEPVQSNASSSQTAGVETGVEMLDLPTPKYPVRSRRRGEEGLVLLQVEVLPDGTVGNITVLHDAGFVRLTNAAIAAARKARFKPATRNGQPVRAVVRVPFRFVLR